MSVTEVHEEKNTLSVDVFIPGHEPRGSASALFTRTRKHLLERDKVCFVCGCSASEVGSLEAHHLIERSFAEMIDFDIVKRWALDGEFGFTQAQRDAAKSFDWDNFDPKDPYTFVDDMMVNGVLLDKAHHIKADEGIHNLPFPVFFAQKFGKEGYRFSDIEIIHTDWKEE